MVPTASIRDGEKCRKPQSSYHYRHGPHHRAQLAFRSTITITTSPLGNPSLTVTRASFPTISKIFVSAYCCTLIWLALLDSRPWPSAKIPVFCYRLQFTCVFISTWDMLVSFPIVSQWLPKLFCCSLCWHESIFIASYQAVGPSLPLPLCTFRILNFLSKWKFIGMFSIVITQSYLFCIHLKSDWVLGNPTMCEDVNFSPSWNIQI